MPPMASLPTPAAQELREAASFNSEWMKRDSCCQQFSL
jgi:hypothetical protein